MVAKPQQNIDAGTVPFGSARVASPEAQGQRPDALTVETMRGPLHLRQTAGRRLPVLLLQTDDQPDTMFDAQMAGFPGQTHHLVTIPLPASPAFSTEALADMVAEVTEILGFDQMAIVSQGPVTAVAIELLDSLPGLIGLMLVSPDMSVALPTRHDIPVSLVQGPHEAEPAGWTGPLTHLGSGGAPLATCPDLLTPLLGLFLLRLEERARGLAENPPLTFSA